MGTHAATEWENIHANAPVCDLHIHPAMSRLVIKQNLNVRGIVSRSFSPFSVRASWPQMKQGGYSAILSVVHLPERGLVNDFPIIKLFRLLRPDLWRKLMVGSTFDATLRLMDEFEQVIAAAAPVRAQLVKSVAALDAVLNQPAASRPIAVLHAVEGAHSLGMEDASDDDVLRHLETFYERGVAYMTLAHFYPNRVVHPCFPFPEDFANLSVTRDIWRDLTLGLTDLGRRVVARMMDLGMLIDLSHCTPVARKELFDLADARGQRVPFLATHVGAYSINPSPYNLQDWEIRRIARDGGIVGVIFMPYWLFPHGAGHGIDLIAQTLRHFIDVAGEDHVGLGTDFDGFTTPPTDLKDTSEMPRLTQRLLVEGYTPDCIKKVLGGNALRVVRDGWGKKS
jgi:microsomal dipeptidase-like Zn-dependent dipeptidase